MQVGNEYNIAKRMRYYQAVLDVAFLDKGYSYKTLNDSFIIFVCLFDPIGSNRALYTFENFCAEDRAIPLRDGTKKIILNARAFTESDNQALRGFLQYVSTGEVTTEYTGRIEKMIQTVKRSELARKEYHILPAALMDAFDEGEARGFHQKALETAKLMKQANCDIPFIEKMTGLSQEEIAALG